LTEVLVLANVRKLEINKQEFRFLSSKDLRESGIEGELQPLNLLNQ